MANFRRPRDPVGRPRRPDGRCRRHPKHQQPPGVCSLCLREKLSRLSSGGGGCSSSSSWSTAVSFKGGAEDDDSLDSSTSSLSPYEESSSSSSSRSSPLHRFWSVRGSGALGRSKDVLVKSRSIGFITRRRGNKEEGGSKGKLGGFWSKLIPGRGRKAAIREM